MIKRIITVLACLIILLPINGCNNKQNYNINDYIGKTSFQIEETHGKFDCCGKPISDDGLYRNTACGYTLREPRKGFLSSRPEWLVFILFDENGIAYSTYEGYRPGG